MFWDLLKFKISNGTLFGCRTKDENIIIPGTIKNIGPLAFSQTNIKSIIVKNGVKNLESSCFAKMNDLEIAIIDDDVKMTTNNLFSYNPNLYKVKLPATIRIIPYGIFEGCGKLSSIILPVSISQIKSKAFYGCSNLYHFDFSYDIFEIGSKAFANSGILKANLEYCELSYLETEAFCNCSQLNTVILNHNLSKIKERTFYNCKNLETLKLADGLISIEKEAFRKTGMKKLILPQSIKSIDSLAFADCRKLNFVLLPDNLEKISNGCFQNCYNLSSIIMPKSLKTIEEKAFFNCSSLKEIHLGKELKKISNKSFGECTNLEKIIIENDNLIIGKDSFSGCQNLKEIVYKGQTINVSNLTINNLTMITIKRLYENHNKINNIKFNVNIDSLNELRKSNLLDYFYDNAYYKNYKRIYLKLFKEDNLNTEEKKSLFLLCYTLGVFDKNLSQKSSELLLNFIDKGLITANNINHLTKGLSFKKIDSNMIETITDSKIPFLENIIEYSKIEKGFLGKCLENYQEVQNTHTTNKGEHRELKPTFKKFINYFNTEKFLGIETEKDQELAIEIGKFFDDQTTFDKAQKIMKKFYDNGVVKSLISEENRKEKYNKITISKNKFLSNEKNAKLILKNIHYEFLFKDSPKNFTVGKYCKFFCCAHIDGLGEGICFASILDPNTQTLIIANDFDEIISKATFTINSDYNSIVINSIQTNSILINNNEADIANKYLYAFKIFIDDYNANYNQNISKIYLATSKSSLVEYFPKITKGIKCPSLDYSKYGVDHFYSGDWKNGQICIYDSKIKYK